MLNTPKKLLGAGADPNFFNPRAEQTALHVAVEMRNVYVLSALLEDRQTNIYTVHDELEQVIAEIDQHTDNEEITQDDEETKQYKNAIQALKLIFSTCKSEIHSTLSKDTNTDKSQFGQTLFQHLY